MTVILVLSMIAIFLVIDYFYQKRTSKATVFDEKPVQPELLRFNENELLVPQNIFFSKGHTWVNLKSSGNVQIGIDELVKKIVGKIDKIATQPIGSKVKKGDVLFTIEQNGKKLNFLAPVSGTVYSINDLVLENTEKLRNGNYESNWLCTIQPENLSLEVKMLKIADEAVKWVRDEMSRIKDFIAGAKVENSLVGATLHDGGSPVYGSMEFMDENSWKKFEKDFLSE